VTDAYTSAQVKGEEIGLEVSISIGHGIPEYAGDADRLAQALDNLITNALKFTSSGGHVHIGLSATPTEVFIEVTDDGPGIEPEDRERLFERFARAASATEARIPGVGLGLAITHAIVIGHHGMIDIDSVVGKGAMFRIRLPRQPKA
jgi:signal transduction histidine kinase